MKRSVSRSTTLDPLGKTHSAPPLAESHLKRLDDRLNGDIVAATSYADLNRALANKTRVKRFLSLFPHTEIESGAQAVLKTLLEQR
jgi:hypothetical protein